MNPVLKKDQWGNIVLEGANLGVVAELIADSLRDYWEGLKCQAGDVLSCRWDLTILGEGHDLAEYPVRVQVRPHIG